jgi:adenylate cyclase
VKLKEAAERAGVKPETLRRWRDTGVIPEFDGSEDGEWTPAAAAHARIVARLRDRGHSLDEIRQATEEGRLAYGFVEELFPHEGEERTIEEAAKEVDLEPALVERIWSSLGLPPGGADRLTDADVQALRYVSSVVDAGFPLAAFLQLARVYGQALSRIADTETRLFHAYVHEPMIRDGVPNLEMAEEMEGLAGELLPLASPIMDFVHQRFLQHFLEQDVVGHMELDFDEENEELGRVKVTVAFADLAGYVRFTEEEGDEEALSSIERFIDAVDDTLPDGVRVAKTIGDEVMVVSADTQAVVDWAVGFQRLFQERPTPRIGIHCGLTIYRDGDYFGRDVNLASRVVARAKGGEVLVTDSVTSALKKTDHLEFQGIGEVKLKGVAEPTRLCRVEQASDEG